MPDERQALPLVHAPEDLAERFIAAGAMVFAILALALMFYRIWRQNQAREGVFSKYRLPEDRAQGL